jgi:pyrroline-5-carboxylate reductase
MLKGKRIGIIGGGKMGEVLAKGILTAGLISAKDMIIMDIVKQRLEYFKETYGVAVTDSSRKLVKDSDVIMLAVKPQSMAEALILLEKIIDKSKLVISIAAGIQIRFIESRLKKGARIVRAMPNTPALIGEGATALAPGESATEADLEVAGEIFDSVGMTVIVKEELIDAVTGLSGSGPAYVFMMIEALSDGGVLMGIPRDIALKLAAKTMLGAAKLYLVAADQHPGDLKDMVASPGGTTIAGIKALENGGIRATLINAVEAATLRAKELGKSK